MNATRFQQTFIPASWAEFQRLPFLQQRRIETFFTQELEEQGLRTTISPIQAIQNAIERQAEVNAVAPVAPLNPPPVPIFIEEVVHIDQEDTECMICLETLPSDRFVYARPCNHACCPSCIGTYLRDAETCPYCRSQIEEVVAHNHEARFHYLFC
jgi:hypothetical protein